MLLDVSRAMRAPGELFSFLHHENIPPQDIYGETVSFDEPVVLEGRFSMSGDSLTLEGTLTATAHSRCCNCLDMAQVDLSVPFREVFTRVERPEDMSDEDPDRLSFSGYRVELSHIALTLALLELPIRILCKPDCDGYRRMALQAEGAREDNAADGHPFSVLKQLLTNNQEE